MCGRLMFVRKIELFWVSCHQWKCYYTPFMYRIRRVDWLCFVQGYTFNKCSYQNKRERMSAQKLSPNESGFFHYSKRILTKEGGGFLPCVQGFWFVWCKINSTPGIASPFLSAISHNFSSHKAPFQTHSLPRLIPPFPSLRVECCERKNMGSALWCHHSNDKLWVPISSPTR